MSPHTVTTAALIAASPLLAVLAVMAIGFAREHLRANRETRP